MDACCRTGKYGPGSGCPFAAGRSDGALAPGAWLDVDGWGSEARPRSSREVRPGSAWRSAPKSAALGAQVVLADIDGDAAERAAAELSGSVRGGAVPMRDADAFRALVGEIGDIDLLCNNAGITMGGPTHELTAEHWDRTIDVNIRGRGQRGARRLPRDGRSGAGATSSTPPRAPAWWPLPSSPPTRRRSTRWLVVLGLRSEAALHGVRVSVLCPGSVETPILDRPPPADLPLTRSVPVTALGLTSPSSGRSRCRPTTSRRGPRPGAPSATWGSSSSRPHPRPSGTSTACRRPSSTSPVAGSPAPCSASCAASLCQTVTAPSAGPVQGASKWLW